MNYWWFTKELLVAGVIVSDYPEQTAARKKLLRRGAGIETVTTAELVRARSEYVGAAKAFSASLDRAKNLMISEYRRSKGFTDDWLALLQPYIREALGQVHDYRQFVTQVIQNLNVILQTKYPGITEDTLSRASHEEMAIYWAARLMEEKLLAALFMVDPDRIHLDQRYSLFHKMVTKYRKIYFHAYEAKRLRLVSEGVSYGYVFGNPAALGVIPHTFIDNALKYSPPNTAVVLNFSEDDSHITFDVSSYGPEILDHEREQIFEPFYRGEVARRVATEGTGFGLALARLVAQRSGVQLGVKQFSTEQKSGMIRTTFRARFERGHPPWGESEPE